ncbi:hypothetical protein H4R21_001222 [Coemansia helicoidea]|uniref:Uncharacterized protein n=1 Tax=Coemansia helicoidea TaxID=1286919 RepID=A0ACC1LDP2_9FUNG|nr:hypothetical protein H4R21_001222 [Coemansia helicoidea]
MDTAAPKPLLRYAEELQRSYSRLIVHSGDILRALPEPRGGLTAANIKSKKDESSLFRREWQHLESVLDEYLIRLNAIRTRAHEELDAARVRCLVGEDIDLTLPEAAAKLRSRLARYQRQYGALQQVLAGASVGDLEDVADITDDHNAAAPSPPRADALPASLPAPEPGADTQTTTADTHMDEQDMADTLDVTELETTEVEQSQTQDDLEAEFIDIDSDDDGDDGDGDGDDDVLFQEPVAGADDDDELIEFGSGSDIDDDAMEDIFE